MAQSVAFHRAVNFLHQRKRAYQLAFGLKTLRRFKRAAYRAVFGGPAGQSVMNDLSVFCRANETCVIPGDRDRSLILEGRREVFLRITQHLNLTQEQLYTLYAGQGYPINQQENDNG